MGDDMEDDEHKVSKLAVRTEYLDRMQACVSSLTLRVPVARCEQTVAAKDEASFAPAAFRLALDAARGGGVLVPLGVVAKFILRRSTESMSKALVVCTDNWNTFQKDVPQVPAMWVFGGAESNFDHWAVTSSYKVGEFNGIDYISKFNPTDGDETSIKKYMATTQDSLVEPAFRKAFDSTFHMAAIKKDDLLPVDEDSPGFDSDDDPTDLVSKQQIANETNTK